MLKILIFNQNLDLTNLGLPKLVQVCGVCVCVWGGGVLDFCIKSVIRGGRVSCTYVILRFYTFVGDKNYSLI